MSGHPEAHIPIYCSGVEPCLDDSHSAPFNSGGPSTWRFSELPWTSRFYFSCIKPVNQDVWPNMDYDLSIFEDIPCGPVWYENSLTVIQMLSCWHCPTDGEALLSSPEPDDPQDAEAAAGGNAWAQYQFSYLSKSNPHGFGQYLAVNHANFRVGSQLPVRPFPYGSQSWPGTKLDPEKSCKFNVTSRIESNPRSPMYTVIVQNIMPRWERRVDAGIHPSKNDTETLLRPSNRKHMKTPLRHVKTWPYHVRCSTGRGCGDVQAQ